MSVEGIKKAPGSTGGVDLALITNEEFAKWLIKEFGLSPSVVAAKLLSYTQEKRHLIVALQEKTPRTKFRTLDRVVMGGATDNTLENLKTFEENFIPVSRYVSMLTENNEQVKGKIALLKDNGLDGSTHFFLAGEPKEHLEANLKMLKDRHIQPAEFVYPSHLKDRPDEFSRFLDEPERRRVTMYSFKDKDYYYYLVERELSPKEAEVFNEVGRRIEESKGISRDEMKKLFDEKIKYNSKLAAKSRFVRIMQRFLVEEALEEYYVDVGIPRQLVLKHAETHS
jgi:hypothetical protein